jgi:hypothetical protein
LPPCAPQAPPDTAVPLHVVGAGGGTAGGGATGGGVEPPVQLPKGVWQPAPQCDEAVPHQPLQIDKERRCSSFSRETRQVVLYTHVMHGHDAEAASQALQDTAASEVQQLLLSPLAQACNWSWTRFQTLCNKLSTRAMRTLPLVCARLQSPLEYDTFYSQLRAAVAQRCQDVVDECEMKDSSRRSSSKG